MTDIVQVTPIIKDEIEFYITNDGNEAGVSISGLARLCNVNQKTISELVNDLNEDPRGNLTYKSLEFIRGKVFTLGVEADNRAKIVNSTAATIIIEYYAFESKAKNPTALSTFRKFARKGFISWVKELTNYEETKQDSKQIEDMLAEIMLEVRECRKFREIAQEHIKERNITKVTFPNLNWMLDDCLQQTLPPSTGLITIKDFIRSKGINPTHGLKTRLGALVAETFKSTTGKDPKKITLKKPNGGYDQNISAYEQEYTHLLEMCWRKLNTF